MLANCRNGQGAYVSLSVGLGVARVSKSSRTDSKYVLH